MDPCHKFAWCLDACIRDNKVELRQIRELQNYFDSIPENFILGDLSMIVKNPFVLNMLIRNIYQGLLDIIERQEIPKVKELFSFFSKRYK